uniref:Uncharacterized protein n=1 Tax=Oryza rufipogon TaxID=4529 RepID=A0A0E0RI02_ORYRU
MEDQAWLPIRDAALLPLHLRFPHQCRGPPSATIVTVDMPRKRMAEAICMLHELKLLSVSGTGWILLVKDYSTISPFHNQCETIQQSPPSHIGVPQPLTVYGPCPQSIRFHLWHTFSKSGGLKWLERSISASLWEPTAYTSGFISESSTSDLDADTEHVHGWDKKPVRFQLSTSVLCSLGEPGSWVLYHAGDFVVSKPDQTIKLMFSMAARKGIPGNGFHDIGIDMTLVKNINNMVTKVRDDWIFGCEPLIWHTPLNSLLLVSLSFCT